MNRAAVGVRKPFVVSVKRIFLRGTSSIPIIQWEPHVVDHGYLLKEAKRTYTYHTASSNSDFVWRHQSLFRGQTHVTMEDFDADSWIRRKAELLGKDKGSFSKEDWIEAKALVDDVGHLSSSDNMGQWIVDAFLILDRLCVEMDHLKDLRFPLLRLDKKILIRLLRKWMVYMESNTESKSSFLVRHMPEQEPSYKDDRINPQIVLRLVGRYTHEYGLFEATPHMFACILSVAGKIEDPQKAPFLADQLVHAIEDLSTKGAKISWYSAETATEIATIWARSYLPGAHQRADYYLNQLKENFRNSGYHRLYAPGTKIFCAVMDAYGRSDNYHKAYKRIKELYAEMQQTCDPDEINARAHILTRVCNAFSNCRHPESPDAARQILDTMLRSENLNARPTQHTLSAVLSAYARAGRADEAEALFKESFGKDSPIRPNVLCYSSLIWAFAKTGETERVESYLPGLMATMQEDDGDLQTYFETMTGVLMSWARSGDVDAPQRLSFMVQELANVRDQRDDLKQVYFTPIYNALLTCYAKYENANLAYRLAADLFRSMKEQEDENSKPNAQSYLNMMLISANNQDPRTCEGYLRRLIKKVDEGVIREESVTQKHFNIVIATWAKAGTTKTAKRATDVFKFMVERGMRPDIFSYNSLISAWGNAVSPSANDEVRRLVAEMWQQTTLYNDSTLRPDQYTYNALLVGLEKKDGMSSLTNKDALERSEAILEEMQNFGIAPNIVNYNTLMQAWLSRERPDIVERFFQELKQGFDAGDKSLMPQFRAHSMRLQAWSQAGEPELTEKALKEMISVSEHLDQKPGTREFNGVIQAWSRSRRREAVNKAEDLLKQMVKLSSNSRFDDIHPDVYTFTSIMTIYNKSSSPDAAPRILELFYEMKRMAEKNGEKKKLTPNFVMYTEVIVALARSSDVFLVRKIRNFLEELAQKDASFWEGIDDLSKRMAWMGDELHSCRLPQNEKDDLINLYHHIAMYFQNRVIRRYSNS